MRPVGRMGPGQRRRPVHRLRPVLHMRKARVDIVLPAEPLLNGVCHAHDGEGGHLVGREPVLRAVFVEQQAAVLLHAPCPSTFCTNCVRDCVQNR